jgi:hypothetical protein
MHIVRGGECLWNEAEVVKKAAGWNCSQRRKEAKNAKKTSTEAISRLGETNDAF